LLDASGQVFDGFTGELPKHLAEGRLELGPRQWVLFVELDGLRPKKISLKIIGE
jgi:thiamine phosphate synthase YjbQ (UPF0047 family)